MHVSETSLKEFLFDSGLVSKKEIADAELESRKRGQSLGDLLVSNGALTTGALRRVQAYTLGIPFVNLKEYRPTLEVLSIIPEPIARAHNSIAFKKSETALEVALLDIDDIAAIETLGAKTGFTIIPRLTDTESIKYALLHYQKLLKTAFGDTIASEARTIPAVAKEEILTTEDLKNRAESLPVVRIVDTLLRHAILQNASDIHIEPLENQVLVRYRIAGTLHDALTLPHGAAESIPARLKVLAGLSLEEKLAPQDGRFKMETEAEQVSFRISILPTLFGEKVVLRLLRETGEGFTLETLGFHGESLENIHRALGKKSGLILITGPEDSGVTTTTYTLLDILNRPEVSIATIENPIEYQMPRINQTQVNPGKDITYSSGLRALLRQDPDIVMIGEIADSETATLALHAAQSGKLVLAAIRTNNAPSSITHLLTLGVDPLVLAANLRLIIGQRLVRTLDSNKEAHTLSPQERSLIATPSTFTAAFQTLQNEHLVRTGTTIDDLPFYQPKATNGTDGYLTQTGIHEVLTISPALREIIIREGTEEALGEQMKKEGILTLFEDGLYKAARGITSIEEVVQAVSK